LRRRGHPPLDVKPVRAAVECHPRLVYASLRGQQPDRIGGYVGRIGDQDVNAAPQRSGQRLVEVTFVYLTADGDVAAGAPHRGGVDIDGMQLDPAQVHEQRGANCARAAAQVNDDSSWLDERLAGGAGSQADEGGGLADQEFGAAAGYEDSRVHGYPQAAELRPAEDMFEGQAGGSLAHHGGKVGWRPRRGDEQPRLVLSKDAASGPKPGDDGGSRAR
jgi:hypothetical protein